MKTIQTYAAIAAIFSVSLLQGCISDIKLPTAVPACGALANTPKINLQVVIREVKDDRGLLPDVYYCDRDNLQHGRYEKPITDIVREVLTAEFECAGITTTDDIYASGPQTVTLDCVIEDFSLSFSLGEKGENQVEGTSAIVFKWFDSSSGVMMNIRRRTEKCTIQRQKSVCYKDRFNPFDGGDNKNLVEIGNKLVQELLPKIIEKEVTSNDYLKRFSSKIVGEF